MKVTIDEAVRKAVPELKLFFQAAQLQDISRNLESLDPQFLTSVKLNKSEVAEYRVFREKVAGDDSLAVERLRSYDNSHDLPSPDPLTSLVIQASYSTNLPVTVFAVDEFDSVSIRFATEGDVLKTKSGDVQIKPHSLIADTDKGVLGILGIKSSSLGKINQNTKEVAILSFGCSQATNKKSKKLVEQVVQELQARYYIKQYKSESGGTK
ncbi:MAG TPA: hypothetical protein PKA02_03365 [Candidatus Saccharibacteria bacterium]|nr:hypothetical protein [Candidatus Saccharibacteria bacterium]